MKKKHIVIGTNKCKKFEKTVPIYNSNPCQLANSTVRPKLALLSYAALKQQKFSKKNA